MSYVSWAVPAVLVALGTFLFFQLKRWTVSTWSQLGIPGPRALPVIGNLMEMRRKGQMNAAMDWHKEYGKVYGMYVFSNPCLVVTDVDILKEVLIKDFSNFNARGSLRPMDLRTPSVLRTAGEMWKRQRNTLSPSFSTSQLKHMEGFINYCCRNLVEAMRKHAEAGTLMDVKKTFGSFTLDVIAGTGFGVETNSLLDGNNNALLMAVRKLFENVSDNVGPASVLAYFFPMLVPLLHRLGVNRKLTLQTQFIRDCIKALIEERRKTTAGGKGHVDLMQRMLDVEATPEEVSKDPHTKQLTALEIVENGFVMFLAGYETTATTLQYLSYLLAMNPEKQDKLYQEIVHAVGDAKPSHENVSKISYLDNCIREALRCFPPVRMFGRKAAETRTVKGVTIPAGCTVLAFIGGLMQDEEYFPEPEKFVPERFEGSTEKIPQLLKELPFGGGPRQCLGMRLALHEVKMAVVTTIREFKFVRVPETPDIVTFSGHMLMSSPLKAIMVGVQTRG